MFSNVRDKGEVARSFWQRFIAADPGLLAAAIAFNGFFALVPSAFAFLTAASLLGRDDAAFVRTEQMIPDPGLRAASFPTRCPEAWRNA